MKFILWWLKQRDKLPWTPPWIASRRRKFERLAVLNRLSYFELLATTDNEIVALREYHHRHVSSWWRTMFL